jgi:hypothetical protein
MYVIFRLVKKKQRRLRIDGICDNCTNPKTKETERTYLIRGAKSIWQSDLTDLIKDIDKPNSYISKNRLSPFLKMEFAESQYLTQDRSNFYE